MTVKIFRATATSLIEARSKWMRFAESLPIEPYLLRASVHRAGGLVEWEVRYLPEAPAEAC